MQNGKKFLLPPISDWLKNRLQLILLPVLAMYCHSAKGQVTDIYGVVNNYFQVLEVIPSKSCVKLSSTSGLQNNDKVMLAQMKGATIRSTWNQADFGDTLSLNNAGNYELNTICYIHQDTAFLVYSLLNSYTNNAKVQLVKVPQYNSARVTDTLKALPWNDVTGTGGILAIIVEENLVLNAPIKVDARGYAGGAYAGSTGDCSNYFDADAYAYTGSYLAPQNGAYKGEGIANLASNNTGGRGAPANGGGGGNNHNNSGAGGSNLSRGGKGGGNSSGTGCSESFPGEGGKTLSNYGGIKIFAGGGGGAGHSNNGTSETRGGGNGGGICFIHARNLYNNNHSITANGEAGGGSIGDGASGGGGGGTIIMQVSNYMDAVTIRANGGDGGHSNDGGTPKRCYGGGGGGGGGAVYFSGTQPLGTVTVNGGIRGEETGSEGPCGTQVVAFPGESGFSFTNYNYRRSINLFGQCATILASNVFGLRAVYIEDITKIRWTSLDPDRILQFVVERSNNAMQWNRIGTLASISNQNNYEFTDSDPVMGYNYYRILIVYKNARQLYSATERVLVQMSTKTSWSIYPNPASGFVFIDNLDKNGTGHLKLMDLSGKLLWQYQLTYRDTRIRLSLPSLARGIYLVKMDGKVERLIVK